MESFKVEIKWDGLQKHVNVLNVDMKWKDSRSSMQKH